MCRPGEEDEDEEEAGGREQGADGGMYVKYNATLHGPLTPGSKPPLSVAFLKKFLTIAKRRGRCAPQAVCS